MFATLSPIPGYMQWLLSQLASADRSDSTTFRENILRALLDAFLEVCAGKNAMQIMLDLLTSTDHDKVLSILESPLMRLCARVFMVFR